jgi:uncharacterized phage protein gp47/JayE
VSYEPRLYDEIVRDLLTTLTGGTVAESLPAPAGDSLLVPAKLKNRPVRRVSHVQGFVGTVEKQIPYTFTAADFELISTSGNEQDKDAIRFREGGRRPLPNTQVTVNYYPVQADAAPLTDLNVGSVTRTLVETIAFELAVTYQQLDVIYQSAFLETAVGRSLDKVVALVGVARLPSGTPVVMARFARRAGIATRVTVPARTALTDDAGHRYFTQEELVLEPGESTRDVMAVGEEAGTQLVEAGKLDRFEVLVAGIDSVVNPESARRLSQPETDEELRRRARGAFHGTVRGTLDSLKFHLLSLPEVKDVTLTEFPNGMPGEVRVDIAYNQQTPEAEAKVEERIRQVKPAGIRILTGAAARRQVSMRVALTLAGTGVPGAELGPLQKAIETRLLAALRALPPGGTVRRAQLAAAALADERVVDARVFLAPDGGAEVEELALAANEVLDVATPIQFSAPTTETAATFIVSVKVSAQLPVHLTAGVTETQAASVIDKALTSHLATRASDAPLTFDSLAAAIRDDTRFALIRADAVVTVEAGGRFFQLTDGVGSYAPAPGERLETQTLNLEVREGAA